MTYGTQAMAATPSMSARSLAAPHGLGAALKRWWSAYWKRRAQHTTILMLRSLDDRSLHDIGIDRSEIESVVYGKPDERRPRYQRDWQ